MLDRDAGIRTQLGRQVVVHVWPVCLNVTCCRSLCRLTGRRWARWRLVPVGGHAAVLPRWSAVANMPPESPRVHSATCSSMSQAWHTAELAPFPTVVAYGGSGQ